MNRENTLILILLGYSILMTIKYWNERKRYEQCNYNRDYWVRKFKELFNKHN